MNFKVANYMELLGESMGLNQPDIFKQFKLMNDVDAIIEASSELILQHDLDVETLREVIIQDMLDDQQLPVEKSQHPN